MYDEPFMYVEPVQALKSRSNHIAAAVNRGDIFAVNMNSGALTVVTNKKLDAAGYSIHPEYGFRPARDQKVIEFKEPAKIYVHRAYDYEHDNRRRLPDNVKEALKELKQIYDNYNLAAIIADNMLYIFSDQMIVPVNITWNDSWHTYASKVSEFYRKNFPRKNNF
jgi:hypothetical protein